MKTLTCVLAMAMAMAAGSTGCKSKGDGGGNAIAKLGEFKDEMCKCKDAKCAQDVSAKMTAWTQEQSKNQPAKMSDADTKKAQAIGEDLGKCMASAMTAAGSGAAPAGSAASGSATGSGSAAVDPAAFADLPQECLDYRAAVERLTTCGDKLPADVRDVLKQRFDESVEGWKKLPAEAKKSLAPACKAGVDAVVANSKQCGQ